MEEGKNTGELIYSKRYEMGMLVEADGEICDFLRELDEKHNRRELDPGMAKSAELAVQYAQELSQGALLDIDVIQRKFSIEIRLYLRGVRFPKTTREGLLNLMDICGSFTLTSSPEENSDVLLTMEFRTHF